MKLCNRHEQNFEAVKESMIDVVDDSILFWFAKQQSAIMTGDFHGRLTASTLVAALEHVRFELQQIELQP